MSWCHTLSTYRSTSHHPNLTMPPITRSQTKIRLELEKQSQPQLKKKTNFSDLPPELRHIIWIFVFESIFTFPSRTCCIFHDWEKVFHISNLVPRGSCISGFTGEITVLELKVNMLSPLHINREARSVVFGECVKLLPGPRVLPQYYDEFDQPILSLDMLGGFHRYLRVYLYIGANEEYFGRSRNPLTWEHEDEDWFKHLNQW